MIIVFSFPYSTGWKQCAGTNICIGWLVRFPSQHGTSITQLELDVDYFLPNFARYLRRWQQCTGQKESDKRWWRSDSAPRWRMGMGCRLWLFYDSHHWYRIAFIIHSTLTSSNLQWLFLQLTDSPTRLAFSLLSVCGISTKVPSALRGLPQSWLA